MKNIWLAILFISFSANAENYILSTKRENNDVLTVGSFFEAKIICQSCNDSIPLEINEGQELGKSFAVVKIKKDQNTYILLYRSVLEGGNQEFKLNGSSQYLNVENPDIFSKEKIQAGEVIVQNVDNEFNWKYFWHKYKLTFFLSLLLIGLLIKFLLLPAIEKTKNNEKRRLTRKKIIRYIKNAKIRSELEQICQYEKDILYYFNEAVFLEYKNSINQIQFKKNWEEIDLTRALNAKEILVKKIENGI